MINPFSVNVDVNYSRVAFSPSVCSQAVSALTIAQWPLASRALFLNSVLDLA